MWTNVHGDEFVWDEFVGDELLGDESSGSPVAVPFLFHKHPLSPATEHQGFWEVSIHIPVWNTPKNTLSLGERRGILFYIFSWKKSHEVTFYFFMLKKCLQHEAFYFFRAWFWDEGGRLDLVINLE